ACHQLLSGPSFSWAACASALARLCSRFPNAAWASAWPRVPSHHVFLLLVCPWSTHDAMRRATQCQPLDVEIVRLRGFTTIVGLLSVTLGAAREVTCPDLSGSAVVDAVLSAGAPFVGVALARPA